MRKILKFLLLSDSLFFFAGTLLTPIYALFVQHIQGSVIDIGIAWSIAVFVFATLQYPFGFLADRYSKRNFLLMHYLGKAAVFAGLLFVTGILQLFAIEFVLGILSAAGTPAYDALYSRALERGKEARQWGIWEMATGYAAGLAGLLSAAIIYFFSFAHLFVLMALFSLLAGIIAWRFVDEKELEKIAG